MVKDKKIKNIVWIIIGILAIISVFILMNLDFINVSDTIPAEIQESLIKSSDYEINFVNGMDYWEDIGWLDYNLDIDIEFDVEDGDYIYDKGYIVIYEDSLNVHRTLDIDVYPNANGHTIGQLKDYVWNLQNELYDSENFLYDNFYYYELKNLGLETIRTRVYYEQHETEEPFQGIVVIELWGSDSDFNEAKLLKKERFDFGEIYY